MPGSRASGSMLRAVRAWFFAALIGGALTAVLTFPTVRDFSTGGRLDSGDGRFSIWNVGWVAHALVDHPRRLPDANIFHPHPNTLTYSEMNLVAGVLAAPAYAMTRSAVAAHNAAVLLALFIAFLATWALVRRLTGSFGAAIVAACGYTFSAFTSSHTAEIQLLMIFGFPLTMLAFHRLAERPSLLAGAGLGAALAITALASGYYGIFAAGLVGLAMLWWAKPLRAYWLAMASAAIVAALLVMPVFIPYQRARAAAGALNHADASLVKVYSATWSDYLTSGTNLQAASLRGVRRLLRPLAPQTPDLVEVLFPGWIVSVMALGGIAAAVFARGDRRAIAGYVVIAIAACWASLGPRAGLYNVLTVLPGAALLRAPARLGIVVIFALSVLAGFGLRRLGRARPWVSAASIALVVAELWVPWPLRAMPSTPRAYVILSQMPRGGVVEFPFPYVRANFHQHTWAMLRSTANWQPLLNGYSDFTPADFYEQAEPVNGFPDAASFEILRAHQVRYVVVRVADYGAGEYRARLLARFPPYEKYLRRLTDDQDVWLYQILAWPEERR